MRTSHALGHAALLALIGTLAVFINASSTERSLRGSSAALLPLLKENRPYLLKGLDLSHEGIGASILPIRVQDHDLSGMDLREARFSARGLRHVRLNGAHLARANFSCMALDQVDVAGADLQESRFDFSHCQPPAQGRGTAQETCPILGQQPLVPCTILRIHMRGANVSDSLLLGAVASKKADRSAGQEPWCDHWLVIEGELEGARFDQATLRCVVLRNVSWGQRQARTARNVDNSVPSPAPPHAGISFQGSTLENVILGEGNFVFSDFWKARIERLVVQVPAVMFGFTSLAELQCPDEACEVLFWPRPQQPILEPAILSLNVRDSTIRSNLMPSPKPTQRDLSPKDLMVLLCNPQTRWTVDPTIALTAQADPPAQAMPPSPCEPSLGLLVQN